LCSVGVSWRPVVLEAAPHRPDDASHLVGDRHGRLVVDVSLCEFVRPLAQVVGLFLANVEEDRSSAMDEEGTKVAIASPGDAGKPSLEATRVLSRGETVRIQTAGTT